MTPPVRDTLTVVVLSDPLAKAHGEKYARDPAYRLKLLLKWMSRTLGFRCVGAKPVLDPPAGNP